MTLQLNDLALLDDPAPSTTGMPLQIPIESIDEDPAQPRLEFDDESLQELAASIESRGVLQAISVRHHPTQPGRWILNFGARRLRASRLAGCESIPAFVNETADSYDQFIENEQREGLKPLEVALFVRQRLALGESQADIARLMGKSKTYVTFATALIDAPDWLLAVYHDGRCRGLQEFYELRRLHGMAAEVVEAWLRGAQSIGRSDLAALKDQMIRSAAASVAGPADLPATPAGAAARERQSPPAPLAGQGAPAPSGSLEGSAVHPRADASRASEPCSAEAVTLWGTWDGVEVALDLGAVPGEVGMLYVVRKPDGQRLLVPAAGLRLSRLVAGRMT